MEKETEPMILPDRGMNICRICLTTTSQNNQYIFGTIDPENSANNILIEKLRLCGGVEIVKDDGMPTGVCANCFTRLDDAHKLRIQCQKADIKLREMYGKVGKKYNNNQLVSTKDQYSQTDYFYISMPRRKSNDTSLGSDYSKVISNEVKVELANESYKNMINTAEQCVNKREGCSKQKQVIHEKVAAGREAYRTRRSTMFKRVTSMESLKNHKEWQRNYIKKSINVKRECLDNEPAVNAKSIQNGTSPKSGSDITYNCPKCNRYYSSKKSLDRHISSHNETKFVCEICDKQFFDLKKFHRHNKLHKGKQKPQPAQCTICNKSFRKTETMVRHLNAHKRANPKEVLSILKEIRDKRKSENLLLRRDHIEKTDVDVEEEKTEQQQFAEREKKVTGCMSKSANDALCISNSVSKDNKNSVNITPRDIDTKSVVDNVEPYDDDLAYRCQHCDKHYTTEKSLQRHLLIHDEKKYMCNVCNMKFFRQDRLKSHKDRYGHDEENANLEIQRPSDEKSAIKLINSWIREELDSDNEEKGFPCEICGKSYDTKKSLMKHQVNVHNSRESKCTTCNEECVCGDESKSQEKSSEKLKPYSCSECKKSFEKEVKLQRHLRIHERAKEQQDSNFKRFLCDICSKTFRQNTGLMFHMRTHTGYKPHVCKYCGRGFTSNSNCINHERTHTGDRPFVCHFCSAAFAKSCTLKAHITTHTGEANYHCKTCGKSFRRLKYLKEHRFTHTGEKPYACKICGTAYSHSGSLFVHEKKCKAQYNNYQSNTTQQNSQSYCQAQNISPVITPIITSLPQQHVNNISSLLTAQSGKTYIDSIQRMNTQTITPGSEIMSTNMHVQENSEISDVSTAVRSFSLIGQIFQS